MIYDISCRGIYSKYKTYAVSNMRFYATCRSFSQIIGRVADVYNIVSNKELLIAQHKKMNPCFVNSWCYYRWHAKLKRGFSTFFGSRFTQSFATPFLNIAITCPVSGGSLKVVVLNMGFSEAHKLVEQSYGTS